MIRTLVMLGFWAALLPVAALIGFPWTLITRRRQSALSHDHVGRVERSQTCRNTGANRRFGQDRSCPHLHLHVQSRFQRRSAHPDAADSPPHVGDGQERVVPGSDIGEAHAIRIARSRGSRKPRVGNCRRAGRGRCNSSRRQYDHLRRRTPLLRWQASAIQERAILFGGRMWRSGGASHHRRLALRHA